MKKQLKALILMSLVGWFFGLQYDLPDVEGAFVRFIVGPFKTEAACKAELMEVEESTIVLRPGFKKSPCVEQKTA